MVGTGGGRQEGWRELKGDGDATATIKKQPGGLSDEMENTGSIEIELQETGTTTTRSVGTGKAKLLGSGTAGGRIRGLLGFGNASHTNRVGGDGTADYGNVVSVTAAGSPGLDGVAQAAGEEQWSGEYRVYKRRWFGLLQLMLLNIIASWDVSLCDFLILLILATFLLGFLFSASHWYPELSMLERSVRMDWSSCSCLFRPSHHSSFAFFSVFNEKSFLRTR